MTKSLFPRSRIRFIPSETKAGEQEDGEVRPTYVDALDNVPLAVYKYFPTFEPDKIVIFYHDAGLYQCQQYHEMAIALSQKYNMGVYLTELRGHGFSGGRVDRLASGEVLLDDIEQVIRWVAYRHMKSKLYLGAHSQACSLISYYGVLRHPAPLSGFIMVAPYFGPFSTPTLLQMRRGMVKTPLNHTKWSTWLMHYLSSGNWSKNKLIWQFDPSPMIGARDPKRVTRYNSEMARYMNVINPKDHLSQMAAPFLAILPSRDDRFDLERLSREMQQAAQAVPHSVVHLANDADFITILQAAPAFISKQTTMQTVMV